MKRLLVNLATFIALVALCPFFLAFSLLKCAVQFISIYATALTSVLAGESSADLAQRLKRLGS